MSLIFSLHSSNAAPSDWQTSSDASSGSVDSSNYAVYMAITWLRVRLRRKYLPL